MTLPIELHEPPQKKRHRAGTHRARPPAETLAIASSLMARSGITRLANVTGLDRIGLPVYVAIRPASRSLSTAQGKGMDALTAKVSALMEAIECWHAETIDVPRITGSHAEITRSVAAVDPSTLPSPAGTGVGPDTPLSWIEGFDLLRGEPVWVPYETATLDTVLPPGARHVFPPTSNGLASGNTLLEAIVHGLSEVIERDGVSAWQRRGGSSGGAGQIDLAGVEEPGCAHALALLRRADVQVAAWDATSDLGVPTYAVEIFDGNDDPLSWRIGAFGGYGTHLDPEVALLRAISEAVQSRLTFIAGSRDDLFRDRYAAPKAALAAHAAAVRRHAPTVAFSARTSDAGETFQEDLSTLLAALARVGLDRVVAVDLSKPGTGVAVVKVIVPGLLPARSAVAYKLCARAGKVGLA